MRHYEIVLMICADCGVEVDTLVGRYRDLIVGAGGRVHRLEDWGRKQLAYPVVGKLKAHYLLMNVEVDGDVVDGLRTELNLDRAVMRSVILRVRRAVTEPSAMKTGGAGRRGAVDG